MGTSKSYDAPTTPQWKALKNKVSRRAGQGLLNQLAVEDTLRDYVRTSGGASEIARGGGAIGVGRAVQNIARNVASFISSINTIGFGETLKNTGLSSLIGKPIEELYFGILDYLGDSSNTVDDVDARKALSDLMDELLEDATAEDIEEILTTQATNEKIEEILHKFFGYYLFEQFQRVFYKRLVEKVGETKADSYLSGIAEFIKAKLANIACDRKLSGIDWTSEQGKRVIEEVMQDTFEVYGG
jgi:hypothetical protein